MNNSNYISYPSPYSPLLPPPFPLHYSPRSSYSPPPPPLTPISSSNPLNYINVKNKIKRNENSNEKSNLSVVRFKYLIIILNNKFVYLMNY